MQREFPSALEEVHVGGGLWLRVKVLTLPDATLSTQAMEAAIGAVVAALHNDPERAAAEKVIPDGPAKGIKLSTACASIKQNQEVSRDAVFAYAWGEPDAKPTEWSPMKIVRNPQDERREQGWLCYATLDQVAPGWALVCGGIALRTVLRAQGEVTPLSEPGT